MLTRESLDLPFFPRELWPTLDPTHRSPLWRKRKQAPQTTTSSTSKKRKRLPSLSPSDSEPSSPESDAPIAAAKRRKRPLKRTTGNDDTEKSGLEAEDDIDIPDVEQAGADDDDGLGSEVSDAVFSDDEGGDYAAEGYFDDGMGEDEEGDGGGGGGEGTFD